VIVLMKVYFVSLDTVVYVLISYIERILYAGGIFGSFKSENNNDIWLLICNLLNIGALDTYF
jgi:hypothetical protein